MKNPSFDSLVWSSFRLAPINKLRQARGSECIFGAPTPGMKLWPFGSTCNKRGKVVLNEKIMNLFLLAGVTSASLM